MNNKFTDLKLPPNSKIYTGLFFISLSTLTFELLISRVMSVVAWYHFAFMAICPFWHDGRSRYCS